LSALGEQQDAAGQNAQHCRSRESGARTVRPRLACRSDHEQDEGLRRQDVRTMQPSVEAVAKEDFSLIAHKSPSPIRDRAVSPSLLFLDM